MISYIYGAPTSHSKNHTLSDGEAAEFLADLKSKKVLLEEMLVMLENLEEDLI